MPHQTSDRERFKFVQGPLIQVLILTNVHITTIQCVLILQPLFRMSAQQSNLHYISQYNYTKFRDYYGKDPVSTYLSIFTDSNIPSSMTETFKDFFTQIPFIGYVLSIVNITDIYY